MNKIYKILFFLLAAFAVSCSKNDDNSPAPLRDYAEQYAKDLDTIDEFIDTHYMTVTPDFDVTFTAIPAGGTQTSIRNEPGFAFKMVNKNDIDYKVYYIKLREGADKNPTSVDSVHVAYKGNLINLNQFDYAQNPIWFPLENVITGWSEIIPLFKTGTYDTAEGPNPVTFTGYGAGVMFVPSALAYYSQVTPSVPSYSPLIFSFKLMELRYRDHDRDGIKSKDEVAHAGDNPKDYDSDGDGTPNMNDIDDDGDHYLTKLEIHKDATGAIIFEDDNNNGIPNYLDPATHP